MTFKNIVKPILVLTLICLAVALLLAVVNYVAAPIIAEATAEAERKARSEALPGATEFSEVDLKGYADLPESVVSCYRDDAGGGYVFLVKGAGYGGKSNPITLLVGIKPDGKIAGIKIPMLTFIIIALLCLFIVWFRRTKLGQDMRAVGQDMEVARDAGINVERTRIISIVMSTVLAGIGMVIYLQNMGNIATYSAHSQIGMFCIAALLVGGASVDRASIGNVFLGVILFHTMFIVAPRAGAYITGDSMIGEYFRVFVSYAVITLALIMYETNKRRAKSAAGRELAAAQEMDDAGKAAAGEK